MTDTLGVFLKVGGAETRVGALVRRADGMIRFAVDGGYIALGPDRPTLTSSARFMEDDRRTERALTTGPLSQPSRDLHPWFSNLLPEGALRELVHKGMPSGNTSDFDVLAFLGEDLPGAVVVRPEDGREVRWEMPERIDEPTSAPIRFSLAGVQLKMSMQKKDERLTFPARGVNGDVIVKLPSSRFRSLPEVEFACMTLAGAVGVDVPSFELVTSDSVHGISDEILGQGEHVLAIARFDRTAGGGRVHMEDYCQVLGVPKERKYTGANEETVMNIAKRLGGGTKAFLEVARRIAVNVLMGNGDAHLKNHSLWYPDGVNGEVSPAYDIVSSYVYDRSDDLALKFRKTTNSAIVGIARFERAAELCGVAPRVVRREIADVVTHAADVWPKLLADLPMPAEFSARIIERTHRLELVNDFGAVFAAAEAVAAPAPAPA